MAESVGNGALQSYEVEKRLRVNNLETVLRGPVRETVGLMQGTCDGIIQKAKEDLHLAWSGYQNGLESARAEKDPVTQENVKKVARNDYDTKEASVIEEAKRQLKLLKDSIK